MRTVIIVIMVLICMNYILKLSYRGFYMVLLSSAVSALFVGLTWPFAIEQSASQISHWLSDTALMLNIAVILTLNVVVQVAFCFLYAKIHTSSRVKRSIAKIYNFLLWMPDLLIFPVLFYILVTVIFSLPGASFSLVAWILAAMVFAAIPIATSIIRRILPEDSIRLEMLFLSNLLIAILGTIASVNGRTAVEKAGYLDYTALAGVCTLAFIGLATGFIIHVIKIKAL